MIINKYILRDFFASNYTTAIRKNVLVAMNDDTIYTIDIRKSDREKDFIIIKVDRFIDGFGWSSLSEDEIKTEKNYLIEEMENYFNS